jgi:hypothetical protein
VRVTLLDHAGSKRQPELAQQITGNTARGGAASVAPDIERMIL